MINSKRIAATESSQLSPNSRLIARLWMFLTFATVLVVTISWNALSRAEPMSPADMLKKLKQATERSRTAYSKSTIVARVRDEKAKGSTHAFTVTYIHSGEQQKASIVEEGGESGGNKIVVASPDLSFSADRPDKGAGGSRLEFLAPSRSKGYEQVQDLIRDKTPFCHGPHAYIGIPLIELLTWESVVVQSVEQTLSNGIPAIRVTYRRNKRHPTQEHDYSDCFVDLDPARDLAVVRCESRGIKAGATAFVNRIDVSYKMSKSIPVVTAAHFSTEDAKGQMVEKLSVEVLSTDFGSTPPQEFSLAAAGVTEVTYGPAGGFPLSFFVSIVVAVLSLVALVALRRKRSQPQTKSAA